MIKNVMRWLLPLLVVALIALYLVLPPALSTHAAAPQAPVQHSTMTKQHPVPERYWRP